MKRLVAMIAFLQAAVGCGNDHLGRSRRSVTSADGYPLPLRPGRPKVWEDDGLWNEAGDFSLNPNGNLLHRIELFVWTSPGGMLRIPVTLVHNAADADVQRGLGFGFRIAAAGRIATATDGTVTLEEPDGTPRVFSPDGSGGYRAETFDFDRLVRTDAFELDLPGGTRRTFDAVGREISRITRAGDSIAFQYSDDGALLAIADAAARQASFHYDAGLLTEIDDPEGREFHLSYDGGQLVAIDAPAISGSPTRLTLSYDDQHRIASRTSWTGDRTTTFGYDDTGRLISIMTPDGDQHRIDYHPGAVVLSDSLGRSSVLRYAGGAVFESVAPTGLSRQIARDASRRPVQVTDGFGHRIAVAYDDVDDVVAFTDALGRTSRMTWDAHHNLLSTTNSLGQTQQHSYDVFDQLTGTTDEIGETTQYHRDAAGNLTSVIDFADVTRFSASYDDAGRLLSFTDEAGLATSMSYDGSGNLVQVVAPGGLTTTRTVTTTGRTLSETNWLGETTTLEYDPLGRPRRVTLHTGGALVIDLDAQGRPLALEDTSGPVAQSATFAWSPQDQLAAQTTNGVQVQQAAPVLAPLAAPRAIPCTPSCGSRCGTALPDTCGGTIDCSCASGLSCNAAGYCAGGAR